MFLTVMNLRPQLFGMLQLLLLALDKSTVWDAAVTASSTRQIDCLGCCSYCF